MKYETEGVVYEGVDSYRDREKRDEPMRYKDGAEVRFIKYRGEGDARYRTVTLPRDFQHDLPAEGEVVRLTIDSSLKAEPRINRNGEPYLSYVEKFRLISWVVATGAKSVRAVA